MPLTKREEERIRASVKRLVRAKVVNDRYLFAVSNRLPFPNGAAITLELARAKRIYTTLLHSLREVPHAK